MATKTEGDRMEMVEVCCVQDSNGAPCCDDTPYCDDVTITAVDVGESPKSVTGDLAKPKGCRQSCCKHNLVYGVDDIPPWYTTILLGFQHFMTNFGSNVSAVFVLTPYLCISHDALIVGELIGTLFVVTGTVTILQATFGVRLPIIQGTTFTFLVPAFSILIQRGECPPAPTENSTLEEIQAANDEWLSRIREIQGAIMVASCFQVIIGATGLVGILLNFIGPLAITPTITLIGLSLHQSAATKSGLHWGIAVMTIVFTALFSQYLPEIEVPFLNYNSQKRFHVSKFKLFKMFPIILGVGVTWLFCFIFTATDVFPNDPNLYGYAARTDINSVVLERAAWFRFPYPGQWGPPTVTTSSVLGLLAGVLASIIDSVGDYYACARMSGAPPPPQHAINRGILIEGIGCILAGAWGSGNGSTSRSENVGAIGLTKVGSRVVVQAAGCVMIATGIFGKVSALFATIPEPVVGGVLCITLGMVTAVGLSSLQFVDLNSSRNLFVLGFSTLMGLVIPFYLEQNPGILNTGSVEFDQIVSIMLTNGMFIGGLMGILLDNTIPGTDEERGLLVWRQYATTDTDEDDDAGGDLDVEKGEGDRTTKAKRLSETSGFADRDTEAIIPPTDPPSCYDLPLVMRLIRRWAWCRYLPFSPTFKGFKFRFLKKLCKRKR